MEQTSLDDLTHSPSIHVQGLRQQYGTFAAVGGIDFSVYPGEIFGLIGTNGAGKSTTMAVLSGVKQATSGQITVLGQPPHTIRHQIGYLTQQFSLYSDLSIEENLQYCAKVRRVSAAAFQRRRARYLRWVGLEPFCDRLAGQLSGGMKQKLALCCALIFQPQVLLLDELSTGIDIVSRREIWDLLPMIASRGITIVVATHYLDEAERCHRVALLHQGRIQQTGTPAELRQSLGLNALDIFPDDPAYAAGDTFQAIESLLLKHSSVQDKTLDGLIPNALDPNLLNRGDEAFDSSAMTPDPSVMTSIPSAIADDSSLHPPVITDVQSFGDRLTVLVPNKERAAAVIQILLHHHRLPYNAIRSAPVTLENVMATHLRSQQAPFPRITFPFLNPPYPSQGAVLQATGLKKRYKTFEAVKQVDLSVGQGEICGLLGANGAGKTTLIKLLCGLLKPTQGQVQLRHSNGTLAPPQHMKQYIGYMSQKFTLYMDLTIRENLLFFCRAYRIPKRDRPVKMDWVLATLGLTQQADKRVGDLSGGNRQRVAFGIAVMHEPRLLFLDEPTSGMDILSRRQFWHILQDLARQGTAVVVTTHSLEEAEYCTRLVLMRSGQLIAHGSPSQLKEMQSGQLVEVQGKIEGEEMVRLLQVLRTKLPPWRIAFFGDRLHLIIDHPEDEIPMFQSMIESAQVTATLTPIPFTLEAAFIKLIQQIPQ